VIDLATVSTTALEAELEKRKNYHGEERFVVYVNPVLAHAWEVVAHDGVMVQYHRNDEPTLPEVSNALKAEREGREGA